MERKNCRRHALLLRAIRSQVNKALFRRDNLREILNALIYWKEEILDDLANGIVENGPEIIDILKELEKLKNQVENHIKSNENNTLN
jgi:hypothetical protein